MTPFSVRVDRDGGTALLHLTGELDLATVPVLCTAAYAELDRPDCKTLEFELSDLTFLDSTGMGSWVEIRGRAIEHGKRLVIRSVPAFAQRVLEIGGLTKLFADDPCH